MSMLGENFAFIHIPKTGGQWVQSVLSEAGPLRQPLAWRVTPLTSHLTTAEIPAAWLGNKFTFAFVRHPVDWYMSFWAFHRRYMGPKPHHALNDWIDRRRRIMGGIAWDDASAILIPAMREGAATFREFCEDVLREPGFLSRQFDVYTEGVDFVGRTEELAVDLFEALRLAGETRRPKLLDVVNASKREPVPDDLAAAICESEAAALEKWGYGQRGGINAV